VTKDLPAADNETMASCRKTGRVKRSEMIKKIEVDTTKKRGKTGSTDQ
jgi:hypothetical protein